MSLTALTAVVTGPVDIKDWGWHGFANVEGDHIHKAFVGWPDCEPMQLWEVAINGDNYGAMAPTAEKALSSVLDMLSSLSNKP